MPEITDEFMKEQITRAKEYCVMILKHGPNWGTAGMEKIIWEHARRNFSLRSDGILPIACPIADGSEISGIGIFNVAPEKVRAIMDADPGVKAGIFTYEAHPCRGFPGDKLP